MLLLMSEPILRAVRHDMAAYGLPLSSEEQQAIRSDTGFAHLLSKSASEIDEYIAALFSSYHAARISINTFSEQYGVWMRLRNTVCRQSLP